MQAIAEFLGAVVAFIFEMLAWSFVGFWRLCRAVFSKAERAKVVERWKTGMKERVLLVAGAMIWVAVFTIGFGLGLPLAYSIVTSAGDAGREVDIPPERTAEVTLPHPDDPNKNLILQIDRSRLGELKDTRDIPELVKRLHDITKTEERGKTPNKAPEPTPGSVTPRATEGVLK